MGVPTFIAGDWGTTNLRLVLADADGTALATINGPGAAQSQSRFEAVFDELTAPWIREHGSLPAILCGMVGSTIGWINVPYVPCPAPPDRIAGSMTRVNTRDIFIAPGLSCRNRFDAPDVMRGEETQILGALRLAPELQKGHHLLCLPGTHTKWVVLQDGVVKEFLTSVTGELFAVINDHSVLVRSETPAGDVSETFGTAIAHVQRFPDAALSQLLFECRSRQVLGELTREHAPAFLSGLIIGQDILAARRTFADAGGIAVLASTQLTALYRRACAVLNVAMNAVDGSKASLAGLALLHSLRTGRANVA
jgi:2-dehydro-3-deoxygalactonokinase